LCELEPSRRGAPSRARRKLLGEAPLLMRGENFSEPSRRGTPSRARWKLRGAFSERRPFSCEAESTHANRSLLREAPLVVRGGNFLERRPFSCEAESTHVNRSLLGETSRRQKEVVRTNLPRELFGDEETTRVNGVPAREHRFSDLKHDFLVRFQVLVCR
jgi:hypothetical protein